MSYAISKDLTGWRSVSSPDELLPTEYYSENPPDISTISSNDLIIHKISEIELSITPRRLREAILEIDNGWLASKNEEIAILRRQIT